MDHERIRFEDDRSATPVLPDVVRTSRAWLPRVGHALVSLRWLDDYRSFQPRQAYVEDVAQPPDARRAVSKALSKFDFDVSSEQCDAWWTSRDDVLIEHAVRSMGCHHAELLTRIAADDNHPCQSLAVAALEWGFEEPEYQVVKVRALGSSNPDVRIAAVYTVSWDESLIAEEQLRRILLDSDGETAKAAAYALQYYVSIGTLHALRSAEGQIHPDAEAQRSESVDTVVDSIADEVGRASNDARRFLSRWTDQIGPLPDDNQHTSPAAAAERSVQERTVSTPVPDDVVLDDLFDTTTGSFRTVATVLRTADW